MQIKVAIVEDQRDLREMLGILINGSPGFACIGTFADAEEALLKISDTSPDVVLVDIHLPGKSGIQLIAQLTLQMPNTKFMVCSSLEDDENIFNALKAGANGYIIKSSAPVKILDAIQDVYNGGAPMSSQIARKVVAHFNPRSQDHAEFNKLSPREKEILAYLAKGYRYKEIAGFLFISVETVRKHIQNIYEKLQVGSRTDALNKIGGKSILF
ncbi:DNA-binding response regulator [Pelobium manganitolerans]|uniref:DNA-binding response regulator n=1 Tax=Pelobium manganitolerans TaxID=1842495 RepID=A0A419SBP3_9SPHI|nr:response regulator transcription factor [Pelobium manganitolerans]RKD20217.1 DNA-binding response regulator [Pelobium manganitolerans]